MLPGISGLKIRLIAVGRLRQVECQRLCEQYLRRLDAYLRCEMVEVRDARLGSADACLAKEAHEILARIETGNQVILLDSRGTERDSPGLSRWLAQQQLQATDLVLVIGSSWGVAASVRERSNTTWSLSALTFPHELARVLVLEQLYRAATILAGHPYHHD